MQHDGGKGGRPSPPTGEGTTAAAAAWTAHLTSLPNDTRRRPLQRKQRIDHVFRTHVRSHI